MQDAASKGLGLVYEGCSEGQQKEMVDALLRTLMEGKREVQKVSGDTKIFQGSHSVEKHVKKFFTYDYDTVAKWQKCQ